MIFCFLVSCGYEDQGRKLFTLMDDSHTGIHFSNDITETEAFNMIEYLYFNNGAGVAAGDINNDGLIDIYFTANQKSNKLYLNSGDFVFEDISENSGVAGTADWSTGVTMADINGDGWLDIYVCQVSDYKGLTGRNQLYINNGDLTFTDRAVEYGLDFSGFSTQAAFFDYDLDGDLDMYLLNHSVHGNRNYGRSDLRFEGDPKAGDRLFRQDQNNGSPLFVEATRRAGILNSQIGYGLGVNIADINNDGYPDIYVSNDFHEIDYLYINNGNGSFSEKFTRMMTHSSRSSMGNDIADFNNDGLMDIMVLDMLPADENIKKRSGGEDDFEIYEIKRNFGYYHQYVRNMLQLNLGDDLFSDDLDNDGYKDIYITNGIFRRANDLDYVDFLIDKNNDQGLPNNEILSNKELYQKMPLDPLINYVYKNNSSTKLESSNQPEGLADLTFTNHAKTWGMDKESYSNGASYADLDNDGDLDLIVNNINEKAFIYRNNSESLNGNHYLEFKLKGQENNTFGVGARISVYTGDEIRIVENNTTRGFMSSVSPVLHIGLGKIQKADSIVIRWPGNKVERKYDVQTNQKIALDIKDASEEINHKQYISKSERLFYADTDIKGLDFIHKENNFNEFKNQHLIPHNLSSEGPCLAVGDVNNDGEEDVYIGGAKGQRSALFIQTEDGFRQQNVSDFYRDYGFEDVDAAFFDADQDGDLDLYVVSGGNERSTIERLMKDRLYINDGTGGFTYIEKQIPEFFHNGSCVKPNDFDDDGDIDLFVGSRSVPNVYGISPRSYLLENDGQGTFLDVSEGKAFELNSIGMVTDAVWVDHDNDNDDDLIIVGEWMSVKILENENGSFRSIKFPDGIQNTSGWWFSVMAEDLDNDGDMDLVAGNLGLNALLKANVQKPIRMYINDFDKNGKADQIITFYQDNKEYPFAYRDHLVKQLDFIKEKYPNHENFSGQTIQDIFTKEQLNSSIVKDVNLFESSIFLNDGKGNFERKALPVEVQFAPVRDMLVRDFDHDGILDILMAGNFNSVRPLYGKYEASYGWFMKGKGDGNYIMQYPKESGFKIHGDVSKIREIKINNFNFILVARNNDELIGFKVNQP
jgi:hypothetical protein